MSFQNLDWSQILTELAGLATSEAAKSQLAATSPLSSAEAALFQMREIEDAGSVLATGQRPHLSSLDLFHFWHERLTKNAVLKPLEFRDVRSFCLETLALEEVLKASQKTDWSSGVQNRLMDAKQPLSAIDHVMTPSGDIRTDASETLHRLFREKQEKEREIRLTLDRLVKAHEMEPLLQDRYVTNREGRWVLPVKSGMRHELEGIIHDMSHTKQTVYMEPQAVVQVNNALRQVEIKIEEEIERILKELSNFLSSLQMDFQRTRQVLLEADVRLAQAQFQKLTHSHVPRFGSNELRLRGLRHPLMCLRHPLDKVVANQVSLEPGSSVLLLSGPNAGGKTVLLKAIGLAAQMARCGLPICAYEGSELPFFTKIMTAIGDSQSVDQALSTFAAHLKRLTEALDLRGPDQLILVDEICGSTDPEEGAALARSFIEQYAKTGAMGVVTSHLGPLKTDWPKGCGVITGSMDFDDRSNQATYTLMMGVYGRSLAIKTAKRVGVPDVIVNRALEVMGPEAKEREDRLAELEEQRVELQKLREQFQKMSHEAQELKRRYGDLVEKFKAKKDQWMSRFVEQTERKIEFIYDEVRREAAKARPLNELKAMLPTVIKSPETKTVETAEDFARVFPPGSSVYVKTLNQDAIVQGTPSAKGDVPVLSNSMRLFVHWTNLTNPKTPSNPTSQLVRRSGAATVTLLHEDREIDLRGERVEAALEKLESELDTASRNKEERVKVIHGHGTEALKKAVRAYFSRSVYVKKWRAGDPKTGGDGITWVELSD